MKLVKVVTENAKHYPESVARITSCGNTWTVGEHPFAKPLSARRSHRDVRRFLLGCSSFLVGMFVVSCRDVHRFMSGCSPFVGMFAVSRRDAIAIFLLQQGPPVASASLCTMRVFLDERGHDQLLAPSLIRFKPGRCPKSPVRCGISRSCLHAW
jgi:hypothetical protein